MPPMKISVANFIYASDTIFTLSLGPWREVWKSYLEVSSSFSTPTCTEEPIADATGTPTEKPHVHLRTHGQAGSKNAQW